MDGRPRHFLLFYVSSTIAGPLPFPPPLCPFFPFPAKYCCFGDGVSVQAVTNGVHASFVIPTCTRGMKEGWKEGRQEV